MSALIRVCAGTVHVAMCVVHIDVFVTKDLRQQITETALVRLNPLGQNCGN